MPWSMKGNFFTKRLRTEWFTIITEGVQWHIYIYRCFINRYHMYIHFKKFLVQYARFSLALEEAQTVDRIIGTLGEKALEALAIESPFLGNKCFL